VVVVGVVIDVVVDVVENVVKGVVDCNVVFIVEGFFVFVAGVVDVADVVGISVVFCVIGKVVSIGVVVLVDDGFRVVDVVFALGCGDAGGVVLVAAVVINVGIDVVVDVVSFVDGIEVNVFDVVLLVLCNTVNVVGYGFTLPKILAFVVNLVDGVEVMSNVKVFLDDFVGISPTVGVIVVVPLFVTLLIVVVLSFNGVVNVVADVIE